MSIDIYLYIQIAITYNSHIFLIYFLLVKRSFNGSLVTKTGAASKRNSTSLRGD